MNKITSTLTGLALVAAASVAPAFAQGNLFTTASTPPFSIVNFGTSFSATGVASYNPIGTSIATTALFSLTGTQIGGGPLFTITSFSFTPAGGSFTPEPAGSLFTEVALPGGATSISSVGALPDGTTFNLVNNPVPEASTVVSFGALLALGGLAVVLRRKGVKNAA